MKQDSKLEQLKRKLRNSVVTFGSALIDGCFLVLWAALQWIIHRLLDLVPLSGIDYYFLIAFQVLFAIATFVPVGIDFWKDVRIMIIRAQGEIDQEDKKRKKK